MSDSRLSFGAVTKPAIGFRGELLSEGFPLLPYGLLVHWGVWNPGSMLVTVLSGPHHLSVALVPTASGALQGLHS